MANKIVNPDTERGATAQPRVPKPDPGTVEKPQAPTKTDNESGDSE